MNIYDDLEKLKKLLDGGEEWEYPLTIRFLK